MTTEGVDPYLHALEAKGHNIPDAPRPTSDICPECGSGILNGEHIANYECSRRRPTSELAADVRSAFEKLRSAGRTSDVLKTWCDDGVGALDALVARVADLEASATWKAVERERRLVDEWTREAATERERAEAAEAQVEAKDAEVSRWQKVCKFRRERQKAAEAQVAALTSELEGENYILRSTHDAITGRLFREKEAAEAALATAEKDRDEWHEIADTMSNHPLEAALTVIVEAAIKYGVNDEVAAAIAHAEVVQRTRT